VDSDPIGGYLFVLMRTSATLALLATALMMAAPLPAQQAKPFEALSNTVLAGRDSLIRLTRDQVGLRYKYGAVRPGIAFDCSGLVKWVMSVFDLHLPRTAAEQARLGIEVPTDPAQLVPGDLLFFGRGRRVTHIGIYVGEGKYVHAANRRRGVIESDIGSAGPHWWKGARRVLVQPTSLAELISSPTGS
jgi:cell wall-associated NlpC family hydrolase